MFEMTLDEDESVIDKSWSKIKHRSGFFLKFDRDSENAKLGMFFSFILTNAKKLRLYVFLATYNTSIG